MSPVPEAEDSASMVNNFKIIDSTLREGELFSNASFDTDTKIQIATALSDFGVDFIELGSPATSEQSRIDCEAISKLGLKAKILTHVPCTMADAKLAVSTGVHGVHLVMDTSTFGEDSHGEDMAQVQKSAIEVIEYVKSQGVKVCFSSKDFFRLDLLSLYRAIDAVGVDTVGVADIVGLTMPRQAYDLVHSLRGAVKCDIETNFRNDTGCAVANALAALEAGSTHANTSVLGIGERKGITPLGGFLARMVVSAPEYVKSHYKLDQLKALEELVAKTVKINVPFSNPVTGTSAFTHKAGIHAKAILNNPGTYEIIDPADFGLTRNVQVVQKAMSISVRGSIGIAKEPPEMLGWNSIKSRVEQLGLSMTDDQVKLVTSKIKQQADVGPLSIEETDKIIRSHHAELEKA
ncbi:hypothetical protein G7046_g755 [Stylonectria norvegica]|nr:hypothetical protein G7046_g755 [Stylonectria norvegica]